MITRTLVTALEPEDPDDGDAGRRKRGTAIAAVVHIKKTRLGYSIPSQSHSGHHTVNLDDESSPYCTCPDFKERQQPCKHIYAVQYAIMRDEGLDDETPEIKDCPCQGWTGMVGLLQGAGQRGGRFCAVAPGALRHC